MASRKRKRTVSKKGELIRKIRKPMAPPARIEEDTTKYRRERERERRRREEQAHR
jgi:hypothetical protein